MKQKPLIKLKRKKKKELIENSKDFRKLLNEIIEKIEEKKPEDWKKFCENW